MSVESNSEVFEPLLIGVGQATDGTPIVLSISEMPHLLVAGATGSGKSCFINSLICSILARGATPDQVRLILIDPKRVELTPYQEIPHLALPVVTDNQNALDALRWATNEMDARYELFERHRVRSIDRYNLIGNTQVPRYPNDPDYLPRIVIVVDELADLMMTTGHESEPLIIRLGQQGRAAGIHLVLATQRPTVDVVTGTIKANMSTRIAFATANQIDSRVIGVPGAENLIGQGDGLLSQSGLEEPIRFQSCFIDEDEIMDLVDYAVKNTLPSGLSRPWKHNSLPKLEQERISESVQQELTPDTETNSIEDALGVVLVPEPDEDSSEGLPEERSAKFMQFEDFTEPDWKDIVDLLDKRIEPCDLTGLMVDVSKKRRLFRTIEKALAHVKVRVMKRVADRAEYRFAERLAQNEALQSLQDSLASWHNEHSHSLAWQFNQKSIQQYEIALQSRLDAIARVKEVSASNPDAHEQFKKFFRGLWIPIFFGSYISSVLILTNEKFHMFLQWLPIFNQSNAAIIALVAGPTFFFVLRAIWRYTSCVRLAHEAYVKAKKDFAIYNDQIRHAYIEQVRLQQQLRNIAPLLEVLARGYRSRWLSSDKLADIEVSTDLDTDLLPACFGFARAVNGSDEQMMHLRDLSLRQVIRPGWRTELIETVATAYGKKKGQHLDYHHLDSDSGYSEVGARQMFLYALKDEELTSRIAKQKLLRVVGEIHNSILRQKVTELRPPVKSTRINGFEEVNASSDWLADEEESEDWVNYLSQILKESPRFSYTGLSASGKGKPINEGTVHSYATIPAYLEGQAHESITVEVNTSQQIAPIDVVVRVDVSDWADISDFEVFEDISMGRHLSTPAQHADTQGAGGDLIG